MDIVAESLSAGVLKTKNVTVRGKDIIEWFESKLSVAVSFVGVFERLEDAPRKNGAVAIVGSKDYIFNESVQPDGEWQEFGDEGQIGAISKAVSELSSKAVSELSSKADVSSLTAYALSNDVNAALDTKLNDYLSAVPKTYKTYQETVNSLSNDGYATTTYAVKNDGGVAKIKSLTQAQYDALEAVDLSTLYVIPEEA